MKTWHLRLKAVFKRLRQVTYVAVVAAVGLVFGYGAGLVQASCGDWLDHAAMAQTKSADEEAASPDESRQLPASPCHGPHCQKAPSQPVLPPTPVEISSSGGTKARVAALVSADLVPTGQFAAWLSPPAAPLGGYPVSIDRPPRS